MSVAGPTGVLTVGFLLLQYSVVSSVVFVFVSSPFLSR